MRTPAELRQAALEAHRHGVAWPDFWRTAAVDVHHLEELNLEQNQRLHDELLSLVLSGDTDGLYAVGDGDAMSMAGVWGSATSPLS